MNDRKLRQLFEAARRETPPEPSTGFDTGVMRALRATLRDEPVSLGDQLNRLFPRLAWASILVIGVCVAGDFLAGSAHLPTLTDGLAQLSDDWLFTSNLF